MPTLNINGARISYSETGSGPETIVFSHGLLMDHSMFDEQIAELSKDYRCIAYDHRGQGRSEVTKDGYRMYEQAVDARMLIRSLDANPCHFVGLSMGGFVGLRLAIRNPYLLRSLALLGSSADAEPRASARKYALMIAALRLLGPRPLVPHLMPIMFGRSFLQNPMRVAQREQWARHFRDLDPKGIARAARAVIERQSVHEHLADITVPTLIVVGDEDVATPVERAKRICDGIPSARLAIVEGAGHSSSIEQPARVTRELVDFYSSLGEST